jgi:hypothetical protein
MINDHIIDFNNLKLVHQKLAPKKWQIVAFDAQNRLQLP